MLKKGFGSGVIYFFVSIVFAAGAISKTVSSDSIVLSMQWFSAMAFFVMGILSVRKNTVG